MINEKFEGLALVKNVTSLISQAQIPLNDRGFLFGHSLFETILVSQGKIIAWHNHYKRLEHGCKRSYILPPIEVDLKNNAEMIIEETIRRLKYIPQKMSLRIIISGGSSFDLPIKKLENNILPKSNSFLICRITQGPSKENYHDGISVKSYYDIRPKELIDIKSCNYLFNIMALEKAKEDNFFDALFFNKRGNYTEITSANFIWFDKNMIVYTAPFKNNCLPGTTLTALIDALKKNKMKFKWKFLNKKFIQNCEGCAMISSTRLILPIQKIDSHSFSIAKYSDFFTKLNQILEAQLQL